MVRKALAKATLPQLSDPSSKKLVILSNPIRRYAARANTCPQHMHNWPRGLREPTLTAALSLANLLPGLKEFWKAPGSLIVVAYMSAIEM